jgi:hypothetical protein
LDQHPFFVKKERQSSAPLFNIGGVAVPIISLRRMESVIIFVMAVMGARFATYVPRVGCGVTRVTKPVRVETVEASLPLLPEEPVEIASGRVGCGDVFFG